MKQCSKCKKLLPESQFPKHKKYADGLYCWCKKCKAIWGKDYGKKNKEHFNHKMREWRKNNPERNKEIRQKACRNHYVKNKEYYTHRSRMRRAYMSGSRGLFSREEWEELKRKHDFECVCCEAFGIKLEPDHIIPLSKGGLNVIENIQPLCKSCNSGKKDKTISYI